MENEMEQFETAAEETVAPVAEVEEEIAPIEQAAEESPMEIEPAVDEPAPVKKKSTFTVVLISVIATVLVLALAVGLTVWVLDGADVIDLDKLFSQSEEPAEENETNPADAADQVVGTIGEEKLTNSDLQVYYQFNLLNLQNSEYGYYLYYYYGIDLTQPLDTLIYDQTTGMTWKDLIIDNAFSSWHEITAMTMQAKEEGFALSAEDQQYMATIPSQLEEMAASGGYATVDEMVKQDIGASASAESLQKFMEDQYFYTCYMTQLQEKLTPTQEQIDTYFAENEESLAAQGITKDTCTVDVRHILIQPEGGTADENGQVVYTDEEWAAAEKKAKEVLEQWKNGEATEDTFAELAKEYSADGNASQGGIYTDVTKGYMVETFDAWIFDAAREYGNVDIVKTQFGYHIMFFVGREYTWSASCSNLMLNDSMQYAIDTAKNKFPMETIMENVVLS